LKHRIGLRGRLGVALTAARLVTLLERADLRDLLLFIGIGGANQADAKEERFARGHASGSFDAREFL
jgi:hypothetical protein